MAELDKFKRRVIRTVTRMIKEKKPEHEMWKLLKEETGCDCQLLWSRMKSLTLKKMKRLLIAEDKVDNIIPVARMTLTDWLMFDLVLVHEDIDVIGEDLNIKDIQPLRELVSLVKKLKLEGKSDVALAQGWTAATIAYNKDGRQCSPMLLQRRWYQLKKASRQAFYNFWYNYRGNSKLLETCRRQSMLPTELHTTIANQYPHVVTRPFPEWEELIEKKLVILPHEIEANMKQKLPMTPSANDSGDTEIVCIEPSIETVTLSDDDESESEDSNKEKSKPETDNLIPGNVVIKQEPVDVEETSEADTDYSKSLSEILEQRGAKLLDSIPDIDDELLNATNQLKKAIDNGEDLATVVETEEDTGDQTADNETEVDNNMTETDTENVDDGSRDVTMDGYAEDTKVPVKSEITIDNENSLETEDLISEQMQINELIVMPQIANVFSGSFPTTVDQTETIERDKPDDVEQDASESIDLDGTANIEPICSTSDNLEHAEPSSDDVQNVDPDSDCDAGISIVEEIPELTLSDQTLVREIKPIEVADEAEDMINQKLKAFLENNQKVEPILNKPLESNQVISEQKEILLRENPVSANMDMDIPVDFTFADDGIALIEDDEFEDDIIKPIDIDDIKKDPDPEENRCDEENATFDLKLLMQPVVYTTKLEQMAIFKNIGIDYVSDVDVILTALYESKPISKLNHEIKKENLESSEISNDNTNDESNLKDDSSDESESEEVPLERVKLSSYLLQKPRSRSYNPIQLCKNPDFNTRLKRLTVGFLSSTRNRYFLKTLKPMTIDVSKTFESKLINGTMYLKSDEVKQEINKDDENTEQATSVVPSAMPVQSLINALVQDVFPPAPTESLSNTESFPKPINQINPVQNLTSLDHVRQMNQRLFTAEITPMKVRGPDEIFPPVPPVQLVSSHLQQPPENNAPTPEKTNESDTGERLFGSGTNENQPIDRWPARGRGRGRGGRGIGRWGTGPWRPTGIGSLGCFINGNNKTIKKPPSRPLTTPNTWLSKKKEVKGDDALLTIDTLNKMLVLIQNEDLVEPPKILPQKRKKKKKPLAEERKQIKALEDKVEEFENTSPSESDGRPEKKGTGSKKKQPQKASQSELSESLCAAETLENINKNVVKPKTTIRCCWARYKILNPYTRKKHTCPRICECCCSQELVDTRLRHLDNSVSDIFDGSASKTQGNGVKCNTISQDKNNPMTTIERTEMSVQCDIGDIDKNEDKNTRSVSNIIEIDDDGEDVNIDLTCDETLDSLQDNISPIKHTINPVKDTVTPVTHAINPVKDTTTPVIISRNAVKDAQNPVKKIIINPFGDNKTPVKDTKSPVKKITINPFGDKRTLVKETKPPPPPLIKTLNPVKVTSDHPTPIITVKRNNNVNVSTVRHNHNIQKKFSPKFQSAINVNDKEKLIYLNNKQKTKAETACPIFLGRNKILLTDAKLPSSINEPYIKIRAYPLSQPEPTPPVLTLPEGVQFLIQPDGKLTYQVDPSVKLNDEQLASLPTILAAIQQQLALTNAENVNLFAPQNTNEIVNLDDDETPTVAANTTDNLDSTVNINNSLENADTVKNDSIVTGTSDISDTNLSITPRLEGNTGDTNTKDDSNTVSSSPIKTTNSTENVSSDTQENQEDSNGKEATTASRSTLLSDLMEMSGISAEDTTPNEKLEAPPPPPLIPINQTPIMMAPTITVPTNTSPTGSVKELSSVTSFAQLKHAYSTNASFFKLDLDTGAITPISVCIKKNMSIATKPIQRKPVPINPKSVIDLTDAEDLPPAEDPEPQRFMINKPTQSLLRDTYHLPNSAKPVKIFKSVSILNKRLQLATSPSKAESLANIPNSTDADAPNAANTPNSDDATKSAVPVHKRKRKQSLDNIILNTDESSDSLDQYLYNNIPADVSDYESSDEEPLAVISKRMKGNDDAVQENNEKSPLSKETVEATDIENIVEGNKDIPVENNVENMEIDDQEEENMMGAEISFLSDHEDEGSDDNCILGF